MQRPTTLSVPTTSVVASKERLVSSWLSCNYQDAERKFLLQETIGLDIGKRCRNALIAIEHSTPRLHQYDLHKYDLHMILPTGPQERTTAKRCFLPATQSDYYTSETWCDDEAGQRFGAAVSARLQATTRLTLVIPLSGLRDCARFSISP